ncbi:membrane-spanning 4-domains subfamily A member 4A-like [Tachyglossus aculeatus]|uniref:membrane-spanning 4-domains subfamily A member 4A-like n=1 Tax=Tachyglossus aculeatus TaxID=9261 RepID=UPI0018F65476|nr:membrane-spanning 4-domains subfamily A member 4A-like [Tachyglossus aculeatus]
MSAQDVSQDPPMAYPQTGINIFQSGQTVLPGSVHQPYNTMKKFLKGEPKILGAVQILIAVMILGTGVILICINETQFFGSFLILYSGYPIWGTLFFLISGSLSIAAERKTTKCLVQNCLVMNIISSIAAIAGLIIVSFYIAIDQEPRFICHASPKQMTTSCKVLSNISSGVAALVLILSFLEFCIALTLSIFGCNTTCYASDDILIFLPSNPTISETVHPANHNDV